VSCTLALSVAAALAAVTTGAVFLFGMLPGGAGDRSASEEPVGGADRTTGAPDSAATPLAEVPEKFLGGWEGQITAQGLPAGTMKVTLNKARVGSRVGTAEQTDILGTFICEDLLTLTKVTDTELVVDTERGPRSQAMCTASSTGLRLGLRDGALHYVSGDEAAGRPTGELAKLG
jgi:hypothetical protein